MNKKNKGKGKSSFSKGPKKERPVIELTISSISSDNKGDRISLKGIVDRVVQTPGPTVFYISDGTGTLALKGFDGPGARAHPEIEEGNAITAVVTIEEFRDELEGEISKISKMSDKEHEDFKKHLENIERERAKVDPPEFLVKDKILDKLREDYIKAATEIRLAIIQNRPIILRHHNDTDGYSSGFALERAILPLIEKQHGGGKAAWEFYVRAPCAAPFYEIDDSIRDTANSLRNVAKFSNKMPLVIIADNGSSQEDLLGIQQGKVHGADFIVVDHHFFEKDVISSEVLVHINPFLVGEDGSQFSAGMLCTELGRFINPEVENIEQIAGMAGMADRINNESAIEAYLKIAKDRGYDKTLLNDISTVIDFVSAKLRFMEAREYIEVLFGEPQEKQKALVKLMTPYIRNLEAKGLEIATSAASQEDVSGVTLQLLPIEETFRRGFYPKPGMCTGMIHDDLQKKEGLDKVVTAGVLNDAITMRATDGSNFSVHDLIEHLNKKIKGAFVEGGGHKNAGAITFVPNKRDQILEELRAFIKSRQ